MGIYVPSVDLRNLRPAREGPRPGGDFTWAATAAVGVMTVAMALVLGDGREFMAAAACIAFGVVFAIRPAYGVYAIVIARPSMDLWADRSLANVGSVSVNPASALALVFIAIGGAYVIENWSRAKQAPSAVPYIGLVTMAILSVAVAPSKGGAITETLRLTSVAVLYLAAYTLIRDRQSLKRMTIALLASLIVPTLLALWQFDHGGSTVIGLVGRSAGTFLQPDPFGIFMGFMVAFMVPLVLCKQLKGRWILWLATPLVLVALMASYTRTGWVGCLFGLFVLALIRYRALLVIGPLVLVLVAAAVPSTVHRFGDLTSGRTHYGPGNSLRARLDLWRTESAQGRARPGAGQRLQVDRRGHHGHAVDRRQRAAGGPLPQRLRARRGGAGRPRVRILLLAPVRHVGGVPPQLQARPQGPRRRARGGFTGIAGGGLRVHPDERRLEPDDPGGRVGHVLDAGRHRPRRGSRRPGRAIA